MHNPALFCGRECTRGLLHYFERDCKRHWTFASDSGLERFALNQLHDIETLTVLFTIMSDTRHLGVMDLRGHPCFAQEARARPGSLRDSSVDYFKRDGGLQHCVARAISYRHCAS